MAQIAVSHLTFAYEGSYHNIFEDVSFRISQEAAIEEKTGLLKNIERAFPIKIIQTPFSGSVMLQLRNVSLFYGDREVCSDVTFSVKPGDRVAAESIRIGK